MKLQNMNLRLNNLRNTRTRRLLIFLLVSMVCVIYVIYHYLGEPGHRYPGSTHLVDSGHYKTIISGDVRRNRRPLILLWTPFFGSMGWFTNSVEMLGQESCTMCTISNNKSDIYNADAVVFHLSDIAWYGSIVTRLGVPFPSYRNPHQVWVLYTLEPLTQIWFDATSWNGLFNWTMSYRTDSDVPTPYGEFSELLENEKLTKTFDHKEQNADSIPKPRNYSLNQAVVTRFWNEIDDKQSGGVAVMSNCVDDARRYRIVEKLKRYISIKVIGKCGDDLALDFESRMKIVPKNKFNLALENSDCKDYVSEKYWRSLELRQIPIVAWKNNMAGIVIPGSYINVYDFRNIDEAGKHIAEVDRNKILYNSYFDWKMSYKMAYKSGWRKLCDALHTNYSRMVYHDVDGWLKDDTCKPVTSKPFKENIPPMIKYQTPEFSEISPELLPLSMNKKLAKLSGFYLYNSE